MCVGGASGRSQGLAEAFQRVASEQTTPFIGMNLVSSLVNLERMENRLISVMEIGGAR